MTMLHSIKHGFQELIIVGDRVLIRPEERDERTERGLILPQSVVEKEQVRTGRVVATGPGIPLPDPAEDEEEPWRQAERRARFIPIQAQEDDYAVFLHKHAVEIKYNNEDYLVVPHSAILLLLRDSEIGDAQ